MAAYDDLRRDVEGVEEFARTADIVTRLLEQGLEHLNDDASALSSEWLAAGGHEDASRVQLQAITRRMDATETQMAHWKRDVTRRSAIALVTAFEVFLRQFLIEKISADQAKLHAFIAHRLGIDVSALPSPVPIEQIEDCVDKTCETFSDFSGKVNGYYSEWLGHGYLKPGQPGTTFASPTHQQNAQWDMEMLFQLRHVLVHKSGIPNPKYHGLLTDEKHASRLDGGVTDPGPPATAASPDEVLSSPGVAGVNPTKLADFYVAILQFGAHISAIF